VTDKAKPEVKKAAKAGASLAQAANDIKMPDPMQFTAALMSAYERTKPIIEEYFKNNRTTAQDINWDPMNISDAYQSFWEKIASDPDDFIEVQREYASNMMNLWQQSMRRLMGEESETVIETPRGDRRFKAPEWNESPAFDFLRQSYLLTSDWLSKSVQSAHGMDEHEKGKLAFATKLVSDALSPTNFAFTNPLVINETIKSGGENLIKGLDHIVEDIKRGKGELKISTTDYDAFEIGKNLATTPGKVVFQNDMCQIIQYEPSTKDVLKRPLMIVPPWINKYYILDMKPENSFVKWAVDQGHTVFLISWVNPDERLASKGFDDYVKDGVLTTMDKIEEITGEKSVNAIGYCLGGTLLTMTLAYLKAKKLDDRVASATFFTTLIDFEKAGEIKLFLDEGQVQNLEKEMAETGLFDAKNLQKTFSLLNSNDLIWSFVVNNYLMGKDPFPFDLLYWNDDSTNLPAGMHSFYLRNMYMENKLIEKGGITLLETPLDITKITTPAYFLSTKKDHIAPWVATFDGSRLFSGEVNFTLAASGHIAGVVNPPAAGKYCHWISDKKTNDSKEWLESAKEYDGSWWPHWQKWIEGRFADGKVPARKIGKSIEDAPGSYVKVSHM